MLLNFYQNNPNYLVVEENVAVELEDNMSSVFFLVESV